MLFPATIHIGHPELEFKTLPIAVRTEVTRLAFGDYRLKEYPSCAVFERKATQLELFKNLNDSHDRIRQAKAFRKLACGCEYPYLLVEASPSELLSNNAIVKQPEQLVFRLSLAIAKYDFRTLFIPWKSRTPAIRRKVGCLMLHIMLGCALKKTYDVPHVRLVGDEQ
jgi:hypothetical protein